MPVIRIPAPLRAYAAGQSEVRLPGETVGAVLQNLRITYPDLGPHLFIGEGQLRPYVNLFIGENSIQDLQGIETLLEEDDRLLIIPSIAGGS